MTERLEPLTNNPERGRIVFLDYLRIFAFVSVLVGHKFTQYLNPDDGPAFWKFCSKLILPFVDAGGAGVVVFFLVSGYIVTKVVQLDAPVPFLIKRWFRIYPLYIVAVLMQYGLAGSARVDVGTLLQQLTLLGDFMGTPYALNGVEWTLRVEILFYVFIALLRGAGLLQQRIAWLMPVYALVVLAGVGLAPIPAVDFWANGYATIFGPYLLLGSAIYLMEQRRIRLRAGLIFCTWALAVAYALMAKFHPERTSAHFGGIGLGVFLLAWGARNRLRSPAIVLLISELTYSVYLFHSWFFDVLRAWLKKIKLKSVAFDLRALVALLVFCYVASILVERYGVRLGRKVLARYERWQVARRAAKLACGNADPP
jgi:peptidoglycan/LPS O-acetylase OafA/YrhL